MGLPDRSANDERKEIVDTNIRHGTYKTLVVPRTINTSTNPRKPNALKIADTEYDKTNAFDATSRGTVTIPISENPEKKMSTNQRKYPIRFLTNETLAPVPKLAATDAAVCRSLCAE
ncbi:hypothetical protein FACS1894208_10040 [Clostridia bacterium]|nr:hypothetical protein FACS1894208_10040 [Clostridia bacterium]